MTRDELHEAAQVAVNLACGYLEAAGVPRFAVHVFTFGEGDEGAGDGFAEGIPSRDLAVMLSDCALKLYKGEAIT